MSPLRRGKAGARLEAFAREVAGSRMTRSALGERWLDLSADPVLGPLLAGERTSRAEVAACGRIEGAGNVTGQLDPIPSVVRVRHRDGRQQRGGIRMQR